MFYFHVLLTWQQQSQEEVAQIVEEESMLSTFYTLYIYALTLSMTASFNWNKNLSI